MSTGQNIGFVGAGLMGHGMAKNLVEAGYSLTVLGHRNREPVEDLVERGAREATDLDGMAAAADVIVLCLPGSTQVELLMGKLLETGFTGIILDCSTSNPVVTRSLAKRAAEAGATFLDTPLSRTPKEALEGQLDTLVGGSAADLERVRPILECWSGRVIHVGEIGAAHTMKLLNNFVSLGYAAIYAEALAIGARNGVTAETFHEVLSGSRMDCGFYQTFMDYVVGGNPEAHKFALSNAHKDMRYVVSVANEAGIASHVSSAVKNGYATAEAIGAGDDYLPTLHDVVRSLNGLGERSSSGRPDGRHDGGQMAVREGNQR